MHKENKAYRAYKENKALLANAVKPEQKATKEIPYGVAFGATQTPTLKEILYIGKLQRTSLFVH